MTHESESAFEESVVSYFQRQEEVESIDTTPYQSETQWFPDIVVIYPWIHLYIEIENDWESVRDGIGQAVGYAGDPEDMYSQPVVIFPAEHAEYPDLDWLQSQHIIVRGFDVDDQVFI